MDQSLISEGVHEQGGGNQTAVATLLNLVQAVNSLNITNNGIVIAEGQLSNSKATLYTVPTGKRLKIKYFSLSDSSGSGDTPQIYLKPGSTSRQIYGAALSANASVQLVPDGGEIDLEEGDLIEGGSTTGSRIDYVITGTLIGLGT